MKTFKCDSCPAVFTEQQIKDAATPKPENFNVKEANVFMKNGQPHLLKCPTCGKIHFFGFDASEESAACGVAG